MADVFTKLLGNTDLSFKQVLEGRNTKGVLHVTDNEVPIGQKRVHLFIAHPLESGEVFDGVHKLKVGIAFVVVQDQPNNLATLENFSFFHGLALFQEDVVI